MPFLIGSVLSANNMSYTKTEPKNKKKKDKATLKRRKANKTNKKSKRK
jgi:hypothetical protein